MKLEIKIGFFFLLFGIASFISVFSEIKNLSVVFLIINSAILIALGIFSIAQQNTEGNKE